MAGKGYFKKFGRRLKNNARKARKIVGGGARTIKTILGAADKLSGGAATRALQTDPRGQLALAGVHAIAGKH